MPHFHEANGDRLAFIDDQPVESLTLLTSMLTTDVGDGHLEHFVQNDNEVQKIKTKDHFKGQPFGLLAQDQTFICSTLSRMIMERPPSFQNHTVYLTPPFRGPPSNV